MDFVNVTVKIDKNLKEKASVLFNKLGISMNDAINMFLEYCVREQIPTKKTAESLKEIEDYENGKKQLNKFKTIVELFEYLEK